jgi:cell division protein ZapA
MGQVTITLNGRAFRLSCGPGEEARLRELADDLNQRLERLAGNVGQHDDRLLAMAALLLTEEVSELKIRLAAAEGAAGSPETEPEAALLTASSEAGVPVEGASTVESEPAVSAAAPAKAAEASATANPARAAAARNTLEARLAEARAGRPTAPPKSGTA